ncbi:subtilisin-like protease SBT1.9 [Tanacetum coccineum]
MTFYGKEMKIKLRMTSYKKGIFVSMAGGNGGSDFPTIINDMPWVLTVVAGTMDHQFSCLIALGNGVFCNNISHGARNKICVSSSENEPLGSRFLTVHNSKVAASVFITDKDFTLVSTEYDFPVVYASLQDGRILRDYIREEGDQATGKISFHLTRLGTVPAPMVSEFSSRVRQDGSLGEFNIDSGTSMACPHASELAAILKAVHPDWSPAAIRSAMMTTSSITDNSNNPIKEITWDVIKEATPFAMGAGHISPNKALNPRLIYDMDVCYETDLRWSISQEVNKRREG